MLLIPIFFVILTLRISWVDAACNGAGKSCKAAIDCCNGLRCDTPANRTSGSRRAVSTYCKPSGSAAGELITRKEFFDAVTSNCYPAPTEDQWTSFISRVTAAVSRKWISDRRELAMFLANILHESGGLRYKSQQNPPAGGYANANCDVRGRTYFGRGYIQLTWCYNYEEASQALFGDKSVLLNNPDSVATDEALAWDVSFWFWGDRVRSQQGPNITNGLFGASVKAINGGEECGAMRERPTGSRWNMYQRIYQLWSLPGKPNALGCWEPNVPITSSHNCPCSPCS